MDASKNPNGDNLLHNKSLVRKNQHIIHFYNKQGVSLVTSHFKASRQLQWRCLWYHIRTYTECLDKFQEWISTSKEGKKKVSINLCPQIFSFRGRPNAQERNDFSPLDLYLWGQKIPQCIQFQFWIKRYFTNWIFMPAKTSAYAPGVFERWDRPWSDASKNALVLVEDIFSICCKLWLPEQ
jgi:hypothetical protein